MPLVALGMLAERYVLTQVAESSDIYGTSMVIGLVASIAALSLSCLWATSSTSR